MIRIRITSVDKMMPKYLYYAIQQLVDTRGRLSLSDMKNVQLQDKRSGNKQILNDCCEIVEVDDNKDQVVLMRGDITVTYHENTLTPPIPEVKYFEWFNNIWYSTDMGQDNEYRRKRVSD